MINGVGYVPVARLRCNEGGRSEAAAASRVLMTSCAEDRGCVTLSFEFRRQGVGGREDSAARLMLHLRTRVEIQVECKKPDTMTTGSEDGGTGGEGREAAAQVPGVRHTSVRIKWRRRAQGWERRAARATVATGLPDTLPSRPFLCCYRFLPRLLSPSLACRLP